MTTNTHWFRIALSTALACGAIACGDDDDSGGDGTSSGAGAPKIGVASDKKLSSLTGEDLKKVCDALGEVGNQSVSADGMRFTCTLAGALAGLQPGANGMATLDKAKCKEAMDQCLADMMGTTATQSTCNIEQTTGQLMDCSATVGELQSCVDAAAALFHDLVGSLTCDDVSTTEPTTMSPAPQTPPACQTLQTKCPNLNLNGDPSSSDLPPSPTGCDDTCPEANDKFCDDGGPGSDGFNSCGLGTDCTDCGAR